jgi:ABC-type branched-subunit amino acid transport system substrate-binding protein
LQRNGVSIVIGTNSSAISEVAADEATRRHMLLWETGAVGITDGGVIGGTNFIRMAPMGANLGKEAVDFVGDALSSKLPAHPGPIKWAVAYVDDVYGRAVGQGAIDEVGATHQPFVGAFPYTLAGVNYQALAAKIAAAHPDALFVSSYLDDAIGLRQALVADKVPLLADLGTSSSYCWPTFGTRLQGAAVGLFASDKPDEGAVKTSALTAEGRSTLAWAAARYQAKYHQAMSSHALSGFSNAYALVAHVLPAAHSMDVAQVSASARALKLPVGTLANGGGLDIAPLGAPDAGNNRNAASVIEEWVAPGQRAVVWPLAFATHPVVDFPLDQ